MCGCVCVGRGGDVASVNVCAANAKDVEQPVGVVYVCVCVRGMSRICTAASTLPPSSLPRNVA